MTCPHIDTVLLNVHPPCWSYSVLCLTCVFALYFLSPPNTHTHTTTTLHVQGCSAHFSSLMGYQYHQKRCGGELSDDEKPVFLCHHCGKSYRSKAGRDYHVRTEHSPTITTTTTTTISSTNSKDTTDSNNNTGKERVRSSKEGGEKFISHLFILSSFQFFFFCWIFLSLEPWSTCSYAYSHSSTLLLFSSVPRWWSRRIFPR